MALDFLFSGYLEAMLLLLLWHTHNKSSNSEQTVTCGVGSYIWQENFGGIFLACWASSFLGNVGLTLTSLCGLDPLFVVRVC